MEVRSLDDCFRFRLLRKISPDEGKSRRSMEVAKRRIEKSNAAMRFGLFEFAVVEAYMAMFHSARALLYRDGVQEKSHFAIPIYIKEKYGSRMPPNVINLLNIHRMERHEAMYGLEYNPGKDDALVAINDAKAFVSEIENVLYSP